jgi:predicted DNA-binding antitoxin AbrB/MazE fold protein
MQQQVEAIYENGVLRPVTLLLGLTEGQRLLLTVERIADVPPEELARREAELERRMEAEGFLETEPVPLLKNVPIPEKFQPLVIEGEPLSETIIKMRRGE